MTKIAKFPEKLLLPDTRTAITHRFNIGGTKGYLTVGLHEEKPIEIFLTIAREGSTIGGFADCFARLVSISLQHGIELEYLIKKMRGHRFEPSGQTINKEISSCTSIIDYVFCWLELNFVKKLK